MDSPLLVRSSTPLRRRKSLERVMVVGLTAALLASSAQAAQASAAPPTPQPKSPQVKQVTERPDRVAAALTSRLQKSRVLVTDETTESSLTYANPDATFTTETTSSPVRVRQGEKWAPIDTTLVEQGGVLKPKAAVAQMEFSAGGGDAPLAKMSHGDDQSFALKWPTPLPKPRMEGNKATFVDAAGTGADLVVTALPTGFRHDVVLREKPAGPVEFKFPVATEGLTLAETKQGGLALKDGKGKMIASAPEPIMYDTAPQPAQGAQKTTPEAQQAAATGAIDTSVVTEDDQQMLVLKPDPAFLAAPETRWPVTVDPTITLNTNSYRTIYAPCSDGAQLTKDEMTVGIIDGKYTGDGCGSHGHGNVPARALLGFDTSSLAGQQVTDARLDMTVTTVGYEGQPSCPPGRSLKVRRLTAAWQASTVKWDNQPTSTNDSEVVSAPPAACQGTGGVLAWSVPITTIAQAWAGGAGGHGLLLGLNDEATLNNTFYWQSSASKLVVTYGGTPSTEQLRAAPIVGNQGAVYTSTTTPSLYAGLKDSDGGLLKADFAVEHDPADTGHGTGPIWSGSIEGVQAGSNAKIAVPAGVLADGWKVRWRVRASDSTSSSDWSPWQLLTIDTTPPTLVDGSTGCNHPEGSWKPLNWNGDSHCFMRSYDDDLGGFWWGLDDPTASTWYPVTPTTGNGIDVPLDGLTDGWHTVYIKVRDKAHNTSPVWTRSFGVGVGGLTSPKDKSRTQRAVTLAAAAEPGRSEVTYYYSTDPYDIAPWTLIPPADVTVPGTSAPITSWPQTRTDTSKNFGDLSWDLAKTLRDAGSAENQIRIKACFWKDGTPTASSCSTPAVVTLDQSAFGGSYATANIGPGEVALQSGDFSLTASDASLFGIEVGRTLTTLNPTADREDEQLAENKIFGPGWRAGFPAASSGIADFSPTGGSDSVQLVGPSGETLTYKRDGAKFTGVGDAADGSQITTGTEQLTVTDSGGSKTTYTRANSRWVVARVESPADESAITYYRDGQGRVTRILAPVPTGVTCGATLVAGCRALEITYASATTATGTGSGWGDYKDLAKNVSFTAYDPETSVMKTIPVVTYTYDSTGHLRTATNARSGLSTTYYYNAQGRISQITPPGLAPWRMEYDTSGRIAHVQREGGDVDPTETVGYNIPIGGIGAPVDLTLAETVKWGQASGLPRVGAATFPASRIPARGGDGAYQPSAEDFKDSKIFYLDVNGRAVNTATFGAGAWQIFTTRYDDKGNTTWELTPGNRTQAITPNANTDPYVAGRADSIERANLLASTSTYNADSDLLTEQGPAHQVKLASGSYATVRERSALTYDEGKPQSNIDYHLVTTATSEPIVLDGTATPTAADTRTTQTGYDPIASGDKSGWDLRTATSSTVVVDGQADVVRKSRYNVKGQVIEERMPQSNGADAGTTLTGYYTADGSGPAECRKPEWAGLICQSGPKAQPASGKPLPISQVVAYNYFGLPTTTTETVGTVVSAATTRYDTAGRTIGVKTTVTPEAEGGSPIPETTTTYDPATGLATAVITGTVSTSTVYDTFGRTASYTDADGNTSTAIYTIDGKVATTTDGKGTTTYTYDGTDYWGRQEHRGLLTKVDTPGVGAFQGVYDENGQLIQQAYPNWLIAEYRYDNAGNDVALTYTKDQNRWLEFTNTPGVNDTVAAATSPASRQDYTYDTAGRLTKIADTYNQQCTTRAYAFTPNTNRSRLDTYGPGASGECTTTATPATTSYTYDEADRLTNPGYTYDAFGRTTTVPAAHASGGADLTIGYHADDMVASIQQAGVNRTFTLDPEGRIRNTVQTGGTRPGTMVNHYDGGSDEPVWIAEADGSWSRNIESLAGDLGAIQYASGQVALQLANLHGDIIATADASTLTTGIDTYFEQTEYGTPRAENTTNPVRYGWLGGNQRSADALGGVILMGVRLYNPATGRFLQADPVEGGGDNDYGYPSDPISQTDLDGRVWDWVKKAAGAVVDYVKKNPVDAALTVASFVPGLGAAAWAARGIRAGIAAVKAIKGANHALKAKAGARLAARNGGNRVTIENARGRIKYDVAGKTHGTIKTPHKVFQPRNSQSPSGWGKTERKAYSMTWNDMNKARKNIKKNGPQGSKGRR
ncbi:DNRLRE domain-containing protein [Streptosporangium canum]|uniref:DNRLRE domain-containing protein n=1 Tax=Streptosporangium canum TaxID=324952 RepID=UPI0036766593